MAPTLPDLPGPGLVTLAVPADPRLIRVVRLAASGLASELGFGLDEIEDLKLAIAEACTDRLEHASGETLAVTFRYDGDGLAVEVAGDAPDSSGGEDTCDFALALMEALTDHVEREVDDAGITVWRITKSVGGVGADGGPAALDTGAE